MDLRTQVEGIVTKIIGAVEELAARVEAGPAGVGPGQRRSRIPGARGEERAEIDTPRRFP
jgi:hypothetical protein